MKGKCEVIQDLLPLYYDEVCSEGSRELVEDHLMKCEECQRYLQGLSTDYVEPLAIKEELEKVEPLKKIRKRLNVKYIRISVLSVTIAFIVYLVGMWGYKEIFLRPIPLPYEMVAVTINVRDNGAIDMFIDAPEHIYSIHMDEEIRVVNGVEKNILYLHLSETRWGRWFSTGEMIRLDFTNVWSREREIAAIYYSPPVAEDERAANSTLIWER